MADIKDRQLEQQSAPRPPRGTAAPHDPRVDPPTRADRRRLLGWVALLCLTPISLGGVLWAALGLNGNVPTVAPPVPKGWQSVPGVYASFSVPHGWSLQQLLSDAVGDVYYSGAGGGAGESVVEADRAPSPSPPLAPIVGTFLGGSYQVASVTPFHLAGATRAWHYRFRLAGHKNAVGTMAWVKGTESEVWLVAVPASAVAAQALATLTVRS